MAITFSREDLLRLKMVIESQIEAIDSEDDGVETPKHFLGRKETLHHVEYGDMEYNCIHLFEGGKRGLYFPTYVLPNMEFDAAESAGRGQDYGNNDYGDANCRQWINTDKLDWFERRHTFDAPPSYADRAGFLAGFDEDTLRHIVPYDDCNGDLFFLLSYEEVTGGLPYLQTEEGKKLLKKTDKDGNTCWWWLRSPYPNNSYYVRGVDYDGSANAYSYACNRVLALAPACVIE